MNSQESHLISIKTNEELQNIHRLRKNQTFILIHKKKITKPNNTAKVTV